MAPELDMPGADIRLTTHILERKKKRLEKAPAGSCVIGKFFRILSATDSRVFLAFLWVHLINDRSIKLEGDEGMSDERSEGCRRESPGPSAYSMRRHGNSRTIHKRPCDKNAHGVTVTPIAQPQIKPNQTQLWVSLEVPSESQLYGQDNQGK